MLTLTQWLNRVPDYLIDFIGIRWGLTSQGVKVQVALDQMFSSRKLPVWEDRYTDGSRTWEDRRGYVWGCEPIEPIAPIHTGF